MNSDLRPTTTSKRKYNGSGYAIRSGKHPPKMQTLCVAPKNLLPKKERHDFNQFIINSYVHFQQVHPVRPPLFTPIRDVIC